MLRNKMEKINLLIFLFILLFSCTHNKIIKKKETYEKQSVIESNYTNGGSLKGKRSKENITETILNNIAELRKLYNEKLKVDSSFNAIVKINFSVNGWGNVSKCSLSETNVSDSVFNKSIISFVRQLQFGPIEDKNDNTETLYPFVFQK